MSTELLNRITLALVEGQVDETLDLVDQALSSGVQPLEVINAGLMPGMNIVGQKFQSGEYFLPHVMIAADAMKKAMAILEPLLQAGQQTSSTGTIVIGTVQGDIHEIGKNLVATMLSANGFKVIDLGVDVSLEKFIQTARETQADVIGLSALLTTTMTLQREVIAALKSDASLGRVKVIVGGAPVSKSWAESIGAQGYAEDAISAVELVKELLKDKY